MRERSASRMCHDKCSAPVANELPRFPGSLQAVQVCEGRSICCNLAGSAAALSLLWVPLSIWVVQVSEILPALTHYIFIEFLLFVFADFVFLSQDLRTSCKQANLIS